MNGFCLPLQLSFEPMNGLLHYLTEREKIKGFFNDKNHLLTCRYLKIHTSLLFNHHRIVGENNVKKREMEDKTFVENGPERVTSRVQQQQKRASRQAPCLDNTTA